MHYRIVILLAIVAGLTFGSCYSYVKIITEDHSAIADPRERWMAYGIRDYEYQMDGYGYSSDTIQWTARIHVEDGKPDKFTHIFPATRRDPASVDFRSGLPLPKLNFPEMFRDLERYRTMDTVHYHIEYDERFGFPRHVVIKIRRKRQSSYINEPYQEYDTAGMRFRITRFQALELDY